MADSHTSLIFINSLTFMEPQLLEARRAGRRRRKGWAAAGPQRPAYSGRGILCRHTHSLFYYMIIARSLRSNSLGSFDELENC